MAAVLLRLCTLCYLLTLARSSNIGGDRQDINLNSDGGYTDLLVAIDEQVSENLDILTNLQVEMSLVSCCCTM